MFSRFQTLKYRVSRLELELDPQLDHSGRDIVLRATSENAGRGLLQIENLPKARMVAPYIRKPKIGMVKEIEELETDTQHAIFPMGDLRVFSRGSTQKT